MKKVNKNKHPGGARFRMVAAAMTVLIAIGGFLLWNTLMQQNDRQVNIRGYALDGPTYVIKGQVTEKRTSCGLEKLKDDGTVTRGGGICDAGNSVTVTGLHIWTGGGALVARPPKYITDIEPIHAGDMVEIRYAKDANGYASTNCESCYIKKL